MLAVVQGRVGGPLQHGQVTGADRAHGRGADRGGDADGAAVLEDDGGVQHADELREALLQARGGQRQDHGELFSELTRASRDQVTGG
ncbi:hypothetical protein AMK31_37745 [Streptomyces sp. TSRI0107]|nr:hypothetical protein AMK31_37745 [Streptomyces sp. TSRI0107]